MDLRWFLFMVILTQCVYLVVVDNGGRIWLALERQNAAHKGLAGASLKHECRADNEKRPS